MKTSGTILLATLLSVAGLTGCGGDHAGGGPAEASAAAPVCYQGTGLRPEGAALVLDSIAEPGGKRFPARVLQGSGARAATWQHGAADSIGVVQSGYPLILYTMQRSPGRLSGEGVRIATMPGVAVDTTTWRVELTEMSCGSVLARLRLPGADERPLPSNVRAELAAMRAADQAARNPDSLMDAAFLQRMVRGDSARTDRLEAIVSEWGWPTPTRAGVSAAEAAFLVLQHTDDDAFQRRMLPKLDTLAGVGELDGQDLAMLTDRVLKRQGLPQRYGTQFDMTDSGLVLYPIEDSAGVAARRDSVGLMPLPEYERMLGSFYHLPTKH